MRGGLILDSQWCLLGGYVNMAMIAFAVVSSGDASMKSRLADVLFPVHFRIGLDEKVMSAYFFFDQRVGMVT